MTRDEALECVKKMRGYTAVFDLQLNDLEYYILNSIPTPKVEVDELTTLTAEVERLRDALTEARDLLRDQRPHAALEWVDKSIRGGSHE